MWMLQQALEVPSGLITGPITVAGAKLPGCGDNGATLNLYPSADGVEHCEVAGMRDTLDGYAAKLPAWSWLQRLLASYTWKVELRPISHDAPVHPTVRERFALSTVAQCVKIGAYRPEALRQHNEFKTLYVGPGAESDGFAEVSGSDAGYSTSGQVV